MTSFLEILKIILLNYYEKIDVHIINILFGLLQNAI